MAIKAKLADGRVLNFPDGTDPQIIQNTVKKMISGIQQAMNGGVPAEQPQINSVSTPGQQITPEFETLLNEISAGAEQRGKPISTTAFNPEQAKQIDTKHDPSLPTVQAALAIGSGAIAEPIAGLAGIAGGLLPGEQGQSAEFVEKTREALTFQPKTTGGKEKIEQIGGAIEPVAKLVKKIETGLGDTVMEVTNSPALAAAATTMPTIIAESLGLAVAKGALPAVKQLKNLRLKGKIAREITEAVPDIDQLKTTARAIYKEIDDVGAVVKEDVYTGLSKKIAFETKKAGIDPDITPKAAKAVKRIQELEGQPVSVTDLDTLRKVAQNAAKANEPAEAALGIKIINNIDDFLKKAGPNKLDIPNKKDIPDIGKKYKVAQDLWGRARKSELLEESFTKARLQASGFENGLRTQFRSILNNKKTRKFFDKKEIKAMERVVKGDTTENIAKLIGRFGFSEGGATNIVGASIGVGGGFAFGGPVGAMTVPLVGQVSRKLAQRMTRGNAEFANQVIRAGKNAEKITEAYIKNTPSQMRTAQELSELLMKQDIDLDILTKTPLNDAAKTIALKNRDIIASNVAGEQVAKSAAEEAQKIER